MPDTTAQTVETLDARMTVLELITGKLNAMILQNPGYTSVVVSEVVEDVNN